MPRLVWVFAGHTGHFCFGFVMLRLIYCKNPKETCGKNCCNNPKKKKMFTTSWKSQMAKRRCIKWKFYFLLVLYQSTNCNYPKIWTKCLCPKDTDWMGNSVDPDQAQSDVGVHCLPRPVCLKNLRSLLCILKMSWAMRKHILCHMRTTKVQISLRIHAVWSAPLLFAA